MRYTSLNYKMFDNFEGYKVYLNEITLYNLIRLLFYFNFISNLNIFSHT